MIEGVDWKHCDRVAMLGPRNSAPQIYQIAGRPIRDVEDKPEIAAVDVFIPQLIKLTDRDANKQLTQANSFINDVMRIMATNEFFNPTYPPGRKVPSIKHKSTNHRSFVPAQERIFADKVQAFTDFITQVRQRVEHLATVRNVETAAEKEQLIQDMVAETETILWKMVPDSNPDDIRELAEDTATRLRYQFTVKVPRRIGGGEDAMDMIDELVINGDIREYFSKTIDKDLLSLVEKTFKSQSVDKLDLDGHRAWCEQHKVSSVSQYQKLSSGYPELYNSPNTAFGVKWHNILCGGQIADKEKKLGYPSEEEFRKFVKGMSKFTYNKSKPAEWGVSDAMTDFYGKKWSELADRVVDNDKPNGYPSEEEFRKFVKGMSRSAYNKSKPVEWGASDAMTDFYGKKWSELADRPVDNDKKLGYPSEEEFRKFTKGMSVSEYNKSKPVEWGAAVVMTTFYGKKWSELADRPVDNNKPLGYPTEEEFRKFAKGMSVSEYNNSKPAEWGVAPRMAKHYNVNWKELTGK
jgi:polyhydroxyalkanoate synthesis regulator phasin